MAKEKNIFKRLGKPVPEFFKRLRSIGLALTAAGGFITGFSYTGFEIPEFLFQAGIYLILVGGVAAAVSQTTVEE